MTDTLWLPTLKKEIARPWFIPSESSLIEQNRLLNSMYYLVKQGDTFGERLKCKRCGGRHDYITLCCVEQPFTGLIGSLWAYYRAITDNYLERQLKPDEKARFDTVVNALQGMPDIGSTHPQLAKKLVVDIGPSDMKLGAVALGVLEGIAPVHAAKLAQKINDWGCRPRFVLGQPNKHDRLRLERVS